MCLFSYLKRAYTRHAFQSALEEIAAAPCGDEPAITELANAVLAAPPEEVAAPREGGAPARSE